MKSNTPTVKRFLSISGLPLSSDAEHFETLLEGKKFRLERIVSQGHTTPSEQWYDQPAEEWVLLLAGRASLEFEQGSMTHLTAGDCILLPARMKHRVSYTSYNPPCIWLAIHFES